MKNKKNNCCGPIPNVLGECQKKVDNGIVRLPAIGDSLTIKWGDSDYFVVAEVKEISTTSSNTTP